MGSPKEECGIAAVYLPKPLKKYPLGGAATYLYKMLLAQQNRGQLSAGITTYNKNRDQLIDTYKKLGLVNEVFNTRVAEKARGVFKKYSGDRGIGQVRYATFGADDKRYASPFERHHGRMWKWFAFAFNGNIANYGELRHELEKHKYHLTLQSDTEIIMHHIAKQFLGRQKTSIVNAFSSAMKNMDGAYNLVYINAEGTIVALRDPLGFKPLSYVKNDEFVGAASESNALDQFVENGIKAVKPGELVLIDNGTVEVKRWARSRRNAHCMFEYVYFANAQSVIDERSVYRARWAMGKELALIEPLDVNKEEYIVVPVPDTARPIADGLADSLGVRSMEGLLRNRHVGRTFIESNDRLERVKEKFCVLKPILRDKKIILVEDSVVRGTTSKNLISYIRKKGKVKEVHLRVACPPIIGPCFYGIDMSTFGELIAPKYLKKDLLCGMGMADAPEKTVEEIRKEIGADSLVYQTKKGLVNAIHPPKGEKDLCMACITGEYPTKTGQRLCLKALKNRHSKKSSRSYEMGSPTCGG